jgi:hypothetical protein
VNAVVEYREALGLTVEELNRLGGEGWKPCSVLVRVRDQKKWGHEEFTLPDPKGVYTGLLWREAPDAEAT